MIMEKFSQSILTRVRFVCITAALLLIGGFFLCYPACFNSIIALTQYHCTSYLLFRWAVLCIFVLSWPSIVLKMGQRFKATPEQISYWRQERGRIALWLIMVELVVCDNLVFKTIHLLKGL